MGDPVRKQRTNRPKREANTRQTQISEVPVLLTKFKNMYIYNERKKFGIATPFKAFGVNNPETLKTIKKIQTQTKSVKADRSLE